MQTKITIRNEAQTCYIDIEGTIGVEEKHLFERGEKRVATFEAFRREVERIAGVAATNVVVNIRSTGGDVNDALLIYDALRALDAHITTRCYGSTTRRRASMPASQLVATATRLRPRRSSRRLPTRDSARSRTMLCT